MTKTNITKKNEPSKPRGRPKKETLSDKEKCRTDLKLFLKTYFPDIYVSPWCEFHTDTINEVQNMILKGHGKQYYCRAAPRGHAKSQLISFGVPIWCAVYEYRHNMMIVSDSSAQAIQFIMAIKDEFEENEKLRADFGDLVDKKVWKQDAIALSNGIYISGKGAGQKLRGVKWRSKRPDLIVIDDLENDENTATNEQRKKLRSWFTKALLPAGDARTIYCYIGTIIHYESLLNVILTEPTFSMWNRRVYRAVLEPSYSQRWKQWEEILTDLSNNNSATDAENYYKKYKAEMLRGVKLLWPEKEDDHYYSLMLLKCMDEESFQSEYQNEPIDPEKQEFKEEWITNNIYEQLPVPIVDVYIGVDPSLAKNNKSDFSAIVVVGRGTDGYFYTLEADIKRRKPDRIIEDVIYYILTYLDKLRSVRIEENVWQSFFADTLKNQTVARGIYPPFDPINQTVDKQLKIRGLIPKFKNGYIKIHKNHTILINELRRFPKTHDDGLDALEMAMGAAAPMDSGFIFTKLEMGGNKQNDLGFNKISKFAV